MLRLPHLRWLVPLVLTLAGLALWQHSHRLNWRLLGPGVEFTRLRGEPYCRVGSPVIGALRLDPRRVRVRVHHYLRIGLERPISILDWQRTTGAFAVFNAGQFYPDWAYMGLLVSHGDTISAHLHPGFQALLVAAPSETTDDAHVFDLASDPTAVRSGRWREVAQSFMLFDSSDVRVRRTSRVAHRCAVGTDERGRLVVCVSEGGYTLADFAELLMHAGLHLKRAMSMDGGPEAELVVTSGAFRYASFGDWPRSGTPDAPGASTLLPCVITLEMP